MNRPVVFGLAAIAAAGLAGAVLMSTPPTIRAPETVLVGAGAQTYRPAGEFRQGTQILDAPLQHAEVPKLEIMKFHVSEAEYTLCVDAGACQSAPSSGKTGVAQTNINHGDATAYADWLSSATGQHWRLPTDAEWLRAAGERASDETLPNVGADPSRRWIAAYRREVRLRGEADLDLHPFGHFGTNNQGVADIAGNIWEWTETCFQNGTLSADGLTILSQSDYCGVRAVQGKHRAFVIDFIRDARSGGCAAGVPPDHLGFRLVREATG